MGKAWVYGDNVDTDVIIPARYLTTTDEAELARHALEDIDDSFAGSVAPGDVVVAGANFGCGSSREHAPMALKGTGISAVVAASFARIFFRNAINTGLVIVTCPEAVGSVAPGDDVVVDLEASEVRNVTKGERFEVDPLPDFVLGIVKAGGLVQWVRERKAVGAG